MYDRCRVQLLNVAFIRQGGFIRQFFFATALMLAGFASGLAQTSPPPPEAPSSNPFGVIGQWVDESISDMASGVKSAGEAIGNLGSRTTDVAKDAAGTAKDVAKDAAATVTRVPGVTNGRERCPLTAGGGADCQAATVTLCQAKGYASGRSLDIQSGYGCPRDPSGKRRCGTESYVTRAMCQ
jgi:hypothetical protein